MISPDFRVKNVSGLRVPPHSIVETDDADGFVTRVKRPTADSVGHFLVTDRLALEAASPGDRIVREWPKWVAYSGEAPEVGDEVGSAENGFEVVSGNTGLKVLAVNTTEGLCLVRPAGGGGALYAARATSNESGGKIYAKKVYLDGSLAATAEEYDVIQES